MFENNCLTVRKQNEIIDVLETDWEHMSVGALQRIILESALFSILISDLADKIN